MQQLQVRLADQRVEGRGSDPQILFFAGRDAILGYRWFRETVINSCGSANIRKSCPIVCWFDTDFRCHVASNPNGVARFLQLLGSFNGSRRVLRAFLQSSWSS